MKDELYEEIADRYKAKENKVKNSILAFLSGGVIGLFGEGIIEFLCSCIHLSRSEAGTIMIVFFIVVASVLTGLGVFDDLVKKFRCGLLIPITGFSHAMTSSALDYKNEGPIYGIGSNVFKLCGSVILYGVVFAWIFAVIRFAIGGLS